MAIVYKLLTAATFISILFSGSIKGYVLDKDTDSPIMGVNVVYSKEIGAETDSDGYFSFDVPDDYTFPLVLKFSHIAYKKNKYELSETVNIESNLKIYLSPRPIDLDMFVVSASAVLKRVEEETSTIDVVEADLIRDNSFSDLSEVMEHTPGVKIIDGMINIRNGSGWSMIVGSRVEVLVDGQSYVTPDLGEVRWKFIPMNMNRVEVIKGASSVLYGSSSINGVVNVITSWPTDTPSTSVSLYGGKFGSSSNENFTWWQWDEQDPDLDDYFIDLSDEQIPGFANSNLTLNPGSTGIDINHMRKIGDRFDLIVGARMHSSNSYIKYVNEYRNGLFLKTRLQVIPGLYTGINMNLMSERSVRFLFFNDAYSGGYVPAIDDSDELTALFDSYNSLYITPHLSYLTGKGRLHKLTSSLFQVVQMEAGSAMPSNKLTVDYMYQVPYKNVTLTSGINSSVGWILNSLLFDELLPRTTSLSQYSQADIDFGRLTVNVGIRNESYAIRNIPTTLVDSVLYLRSSGDTNTDGGGWAFDLDTLSYDSKSSFTDKNNLIFRAGINYKINDLTYLRASSGQAYRFPTLIERYMKSTSNDIVHLTQNPVLRSEFGWSTEIGVKRIIPLEQGPGYIDVVGFLMNYDDYIELRFDEAYYPDEQRYQTIYRFENINDVRIVGIEMSGMGEFSLFGLPLKVYGGYTGSLPYDMGVVRGSGKSYLSHIFGTFDGFDNEPWTDGNANNAYDHAEPCEDVDGDGQCGDNEIFIDLNSNGTWDPAEGYIDSNGNNQFDNEYVNILPYRHLHMGRVDVETEVNNLSVGVNINLNSGIARADWFLENVFGSNSDFAQVPGMGKYLYDKPYALINLRLGYGFDSGMRFSVVVKNITNKEYASRPGYMGGPREYVFRIDYDI